jgi:WD40 repeat protein
MNAQDFFQVSGGHRGAIRTIAYDGNRVITAGEDGFLGFWNLQRRAVEERFQISELPLKAMCLHPEKRRLAVIESDGKRRRVSTWDYGTKERLFSMDFNAEPAFIAYSGAGGFLIVAKSDRTGTVCLDGDTGELLYTIPDIAGGATLAATGKSETSMVSYMPSGVISYWNLAQKQEIQQCGTVAGLQTPILFGNNRFIAGIGGDSSGAKGLFVVDAVTGKTLDYDPRITNGSVYVVQSDSQDFICISEDGANGAVVQTIYFFTINSRRKIEAKQDLSIIDSQFRVESLTALQQGVAFGAADGNVRIFNKNGVSLELAVKNPLVAKELAVVKGDDSIVFLVNGSFAVMPLDWTLLPEKGVSFGATDFTRISDAEGGFILWSEDGRKPHYLTIDGNDVELSYQGKFPLRAVTTFNGKALFLDSVGEITALSLETNKSVFSFSSAGSLDATFLDDRNLIVGRGDGIAPFLKVNLATGETVPLAYPAMVGARVYRSASGAVYGGVVSHEKGERKTILIRLDMSNTAQSPVLMETHGENLAFALAETGGTVASTLLDGWAVMIGGNEAYAALERKGGFPVHLVDGGNFFVSVDTDGVISWHDPQTGFLSAQFRLYKDEWTLEQKTENAPLIIRVKYD